jgi:chromosomal replication initiator protein
MASSIKRNIRELEGALNILAAYQKLNSSQPDLKTVKSLLKNLTSSQNRVVNAKRIIHSVANFYDLKERELISTSRKKEIVVPRQIAMYLLRKELKASFPFIGRKLGGKDHTTAIHAYEKISKEIDKDESLGEEIGLIRQRILYG